MNPVWTSVLAVAGTLGGVLLSGWMQYRINKAQRADANLRSQQDNAVAAVAQLKRALDRHRSQMWTFRNDHHTHEKVSGRRRAQWWPWPWRTLRRSDDTARTQPTGLDEVHETRSAISEPLTRVQLYLRSLAPAAKAATDAVYAMRNSKDTDHLDELRRAALAAADQFVAEASDQFALLGIGLTLPADMTSQSAMSGAR